ncbi:hypothetical protein TruAng_012170 [Truncatella angustata]|nr:hypothetical protein TruAng_012170 [Truncatella angustata]
MQAWVLNNGQNAKAAPGVNQGFAQDDSGSPQKGHVLHHQPNPAHPIPAPAPAPANSPPRTTQPQSRMPIINANANSRAAGAAAARLPPALSRPVSARPNHQLSHIREASLHAPRNRGASTEPLQNMHRQVQSQGQGPFWEGSTIEGSTLSETASNADLRLPTQSRMPYLDTAFKPRSMTRQQSKRDSDRDRPPFIIGENGLIDVLGSNPAARRSSTPEFRSKSTSKGFGQESDDYVEEPRYQPDLEKTPPGTLNHRGGRLPLRTTKRETFAERTTYPSATEEPSSPPEKTYQTPDDVMDYAARDGRGHLRVPGVRDTQRTTVFENLDTPITSRQDLQDLPETEVDVESVDDQPTPKPAVKSAQPVNRQLFTEETTVIRRGNSLRESSMPRPEPEKRHSIEKRQPVEKRQSIEKRPSVEKRQPPEQRPSYSNLKKRSFDLDYDDSALAAMNYAELKDQDFDFDPAQAESNSLQRPLQGTLPEKLHHFLHKDAGAQTSFFTNMPVRDWDDSGDWFLEQFGDIMNRLKDARKDKRKRVDDFEREIAEREDAVEKKMRGIDQTLDDFRKEGQVMMKNKELE